MEKKISCKKCGHHFSVDKNLNQRIDGFKSFVKQIEKRISGELVDEKRRMEVDDIDVNTIAACPNCGEEVIIKDYKFFGLFGSNATRNLLLFFIFIIFLFSIYMIFYDL